MCILVSIALQARPYGISPTHFWDFKNVSMCVEIAKTIGITGVGGFVQKCVAVAQKCVAVIFRYKKALKVTFYTIF